MVTMLASRENASLLAVIVSVFASVNSGFPISLSAARDAGFQWLFDLCPNRWAADAQCRSGVARATASLIDCSRLDVERVREHLRSRPCRVAIRVSYWWGSLHAAGCPLLIQVRPGRGDHGADHHGCPRRRLPCRCVRPDDCVASRQAEVRGGARAHTIIGTAVWGQGPNGIGAALHTALSMSTRVPVLSVVVVVCVWRRLQPARERPEVCQRGTDGQHVVQAERQRRRGSMEDLGAERIGDPDLAPYLESIVRQSNTLVSSRQDQIRRDRERLHDAITELDLHKTTETKRLNERVQELDQAFRRTLAALQERFVREAVALSDQFKAQVADARRAFDQRLRDRATALAVDLDDDATAAVDLPAAPPSRAGSNARPPWVPPHPPPPRAPSLPGRALRVDELDDDRPETENQPPVVVAQPAKPARSASAYAAVMDWLEPRRPADRGQQQGSPAPIDVVRRGAFRARPPPVQRSSSSPTPRRTRPWGAQDRERASRARAARRLLRASLSSTDDDGADDNGRRAPAPAGEFAAGRLRKLNIQLFSWVPPPTR